MNNKLKNFAIWLHLYVVSKILKIFNLKLSLYRDDSDNMSAVFNKLRVVDRLRLNTSSDEFNFIRYIVNSPLIVKTRSQIFQDMFVLYILKNKRNGFFVEFGACDGIDLSNTYILEKEMGWQGILAEPAISFHHNLSKNRSCGIDKRCVWSESDKDVLFKEVEGTGLSTISNFVDSGSLKYLRKKGVEYNVKTVSLVELLRDHGAPEEIDYLSIDTEGSELEILENFDFNQYKIKIITVEHNYSNTRNKMRDLLVGNGYKRVLRSLSQTDDWYVLND